MKGGTNMESKYMLGMIALAMVALFGVSMISAMEGKGLMKSGLTDEQKANIKEKREAIRNALESNDYAAWKSLAEERMAKKNLENFDLSEDHFNQAVERYGKMSQLREAVKEAHESGDYSEVKELQKELGLKKGNKIIKQHFVRLHKNRA
ncbi:MAG: hypothetical protein RL557_1060 [archaeon]